MKEQIIKLNSECPVNSHNEWDPLEEVIVGNVDHAIFNLGVPYAQQMFSKNEMSKFLKQFSILSPFPKTYINKARDSLKGFIHILKSEGVVVKQAESYNFNTEFGTPDWRSSFGFNAANPRDSMLIVGNEIIEAPMATKDRYFECFPYRSIIKEYFIQGAKWTSAPKPQLLDTLLDKKYKGSLKKKIGVFCLDNFEPVFDAADFVRCGRDLFGQLSHTTNQMGIDWLQRHLGDNYHIHLIKNLDPKAWHIDTTFMPLAPGKVLINPEFVNPKKLPTILKSWDVLIAPKPVPYKVKPKVMSNWISINTLMLDEKRIIVEKRQKPLIDALKKWGFEPIPCSFEDFYPLMGGFHCAALDVRRKGELKSYF